MLEPNPTLRVAVLDMQPITPPIGGGRQRLLGVWHDLGPNFVAEYVGTYDWPGELAVMNRLSASLTEVTVPLHDRHFAVLNYFARASGRQSLIDTIFSSLVPASPAYVDRTRAAIEDASVVAFSHPWVYPALADHLDNKYVVYDSHNVELMLKARGLARNPLGRDVIRSVARTEGALIDRADAVLACSTEDKNSLALLYGKDLDRISIVPNGVFCDDLDADDLADPASSGTLTCVFLGSDFAPNVEAAAFIIDRLASRLPDVGFRLVGAVSQNAGIAAAAARTPNVELCGLVSKERKLKLFRQSHLALNPMLSGSGTNIKMFDFMAMGLPIVSTPTGARGIARSDRAGVLVRGTEDFHATIAELQSSPPRRRQLGKANRSLAVAEFSWAAISRRAGVAIARMVETGAPGRASAPAFETEARGAGAARIEPGARIAVVSTFAVKCGIAEYAAAFVDALADLGCDMRIVAASTPTEMPSPTRHPLDVGWHFDNVKWVHSRFVPETIVSLVAARGGCGHVNIQYHPAFYPADSLVECVRLLRSAGMAVSVTFHNSRDIAVSTTTRLRALDTTVFVHSEDERKRFAGHAFYLPFGIKPSTVGEIGGGGEIRIGSFGFIRPHKGIAELISAMLIVRQVYPGAVLHALCAIYPSSDSEAEAARCRSLIAAHGLDEAVEFDTQFLPTETIEQAMSRMTVAVFPYGESSEGASAAANAALAAGLPVLASRSTIFTPLEDTVLQFEDISAEGIALAILDFLGNHACRKVLSDRTSAYRREHAWSTVARRFCAHADLSCPAKQLVEAS